MKAGKTILFFLLVIALGVYIQFFERGTLSTDEQRALNRKVFQIRVDQIREISMRTAEFSAEVIRTESGWELGHPAGARASEPAVHQLLSRLRTLNRGALITPADMRERELTLADFGLAVPQLVLTLVTDHETRTYRIGDPDPLERQVYVKEEDTQYVMAVSSDLLEILPEHPFALRDLRLFTFPLADARTLDLITGDETTRLELVNDQWRFTSPVSARANQQQVVELVQTLLQARMEGAVPDPSSEVMEQFRRREDVIRIGSVGSQIPVEITLGGDVPDMPESIYARIAGEEGLVTVSKGLRVFAQTPAIRLRDRHVLRGELADYFQVSMESPDLNVMVRRDPAYGWQVREPVKREASGARIQRMVQAWLDARVERFLQPGENGDEEPAVAATFTFYLHENGDERKQVWEILEGNVPGGRTRARPKGSPEIFQIVPDILAFSPRELLPYFGRRVLSFDPSAVLRLSLRNEAGEDLTLERSDADYSWEVAGNGGPVNLAHVEELLASLSTLYAEELIALGSDALSEYGLDEPEKRIAIGLGGESPSHRSLLLVQDEESDRWLGAVQGENLIFSLSPGLGELLREPWLLNQESTAEDGDAQAEQDPS